MRKKIVHSITLILAVTMAVFLPVTARAASGTSCATSTAKIYSAVLNRLSCPVTSIAVEGKSASVKLASYVIGTRTICTPSTTPSATPSPTQNQSQTPTPTPVPPNYTQGTCSAQAQLMAEWINLERARVGRLPLTLDSALCGAADLKSQDMYAKNYFAHKSPTYGSASDMLKTLGIKVNAVGENIAKHATLEKAHAAFMSSDGHRQNILSSSWTKMGIGVKNAGSYVLVTELFAR